MPVSQPTYLSLKPGCLLQIGKARNSRNSPKLLRTFLGIRIYEVVVEIISYRSLGIICNVFPLATTESGEANNDHDRSRKFQLKILIHG